MWPAGQRACCGVMDERWTLVIHRERQDIQREMIVIQIEVRHQNGEAGLPKDKARYPMGEACHPKPEFRHQKRVSRRLKHEARHLKVEVQNVSSDNLLLLVLLYSRKLFIVTVRPTLLPPAARYTNALSILARPLYTAATRCLLQQGTINIVSLALHSCRPRPSTPCPLRSTLLSPTVRCI